MHMHALSDDCQTCGTRGGLAGIWCGNVAHVQTGRPRVPDQGVRLEVLSSHVTGLLIWRLEGPDGLAECRWAGGGER